MVCVSFKQKRKSESGIVGAWERCYDRYWHYEDAVSQPESLSCVGCSSSWLATSSSCSHRPLYLSGWQKETAQSVLKFVIMTLLSSFSPPPLPPPPSPPPPSSYISCLPEYCGVVWDTVLVAGSTARKGQGAWHTPCSSGQPALTVTRCIQTHHHEWTATVCVCKTIERMCVYKKPIWAPILHIKEKEN